MADKQTSWQKIRNNRPSVVTKFCLSGPQLFSDKWWPSSIKSIEKKKITNTPTRSRALYHRIELLIIKWNYTTVYFCKITKINWQESYFNLSSDTLHSLTEWNLVNNVCHASWCRLEAKEERGLWPLSGINCFGQMRNFPHAASQAQHILIRLTRMKSTSLLKNTTGFYVT